MFDAPYTYALTGTLPPGLSFAKATRTISGTPTTAGTYSGLQVTASDASTPIQTASTSTFSITVTDALALSGSPATTTVAGTSYSAAFTATGGTSPYTYLITGFLPPAEPLKNRRFSGFS